MRNFFYSCSLLFALFISACGEDLIEDPIMTAQVNGRSFTACKGSGKNVSLPKDNVEISYSEDGRLKIKGSDSCKDTIKIILMDIQNVQGTGTFQINHEHQMSNSAGNSGGLQFPYYHPANLQGMFSTGPQYTGTITITQFDLTNRSLSADFEMDVYNAGAASIYRIREGKLRDAPF